MCYIVAGEIIKANEGRLIEEIESANVNNVDELESILRKHEFTTCVSTEDDSNKDTNSDTGVLQFHKQHYLILIVKWLLINTYGRKAGYLNSQLSEERLRKKLKYCQEYINVLNIIDPGISHNRGKRH